MFLWNVSSSLIFDLDQQSLPASPAALTQASKQRHLAGWPAAAPLRAGGWGRAMYGLSRCVGSEEELAKKDGTAGRSSQVPVDSLTTNVRSKKVWLGMQTWLRTPP